MSESEAEERQGRFRVLYDSARPRLAAYALRRTISPEDAADVVADTFAIAWRRLEDLPEGQEAVLWLYATARRVLANHHRRLRRRTELVDRLGAELSPALAAEGPVDPDQMAAITALRNLEEDDRELLMLVSWDGLSTAEVARLFGCSPVAARIRLHRARARLVVEMESSGLEAQHSTPPGHSLLRATAPVEEPEPTGAVVDGRRERRAEVR